MSSASNMADGNAAKQAGKQKAGAHGLRFPESFQRTAVTDDQDMSDDANESTRSSEENFDWTHEEPEESSRRFSRNSNVMRLENVMNSVSIEHSLAGGSQSLSRSPSRTEDRNFDPSPHPDLDDEEVQRPPGPGGVKKRKVKMHPCPQCGKEFPRPSGLRTHMNIHTKEKPFSCAYPGCDRTCSVESNAKRHMRMHGMGVSADDMESIQPPYVIGFEPPVVVPPDAAAAQIKKQPFRLRWPSSSTADKRLIVPAALPVSSADSPSASGSLGQDRGRRGRPSVDESGGDEEDG